MPIFDLDPDHEDLKVMPKAGDNYVSVDLLFPKGRTMTLMVTPRDVPIPIPSSTHVNIW